ncbi:uncharacterized protein si:ch73-100l22.3 isoform X2 [Hippoglossus stenolepis]|uniref:uncharacterized protein si:ch73-100l22.3 isoform X2 n=1 Tax=Hippoglossus stenolepis TaxID=195615 RepID=UPI00159C8689|nr:uncharacterized protein si:ch73-100l22.3 isoform X2 [Hippoglossus stenolepis]
MNLMEDYDKFVQRRFSRLRRSEEEEEEEEHSRPSPASSLIRVHGRPILPPLLSGEQRAEMQRHRDAAKKAAGHRKLKAHPRMAYVQSILHSVQLRTTPTMEELLQESEINIRSSYSQNTSGGSASQSHFFNETTKDSPSLSPPVVRKREDGLSPPRLASTVSSAFLISNVTPQGSYNESCLADQHDSQQGPQPSSPNGAIHESVSSGYVTFENVENTVFVSGMIDAGSGICGFSSSEGAYSMDGFFLQSTSNTITKMPEIISHPPIDGEELERSGLELSLCNNFIAEQDICCISFQDDSATCDSLTAETSESSLLESTESGDDVQSTGKHDLDRDHILDRSEDPVSLLENSGFSDNPELSDTLSTHCNPAAQLHTEHEPTEPADSSVDEAKPSEEPYHTSLQALLKKSQEYRRHQRMLRNQAKNTKVQKRNQEPKTRPEDQSLSDKENEESPCKVTVTPEEKKTRMIESDFTGKITDVKSESKHLTGDINTKEITRVEEEEITFKNNKLNSSQEVLTEPKQISAIIQQQPVAKEVSPVQEAFYLPTEQSNLCPGYIFPRVRKSYTIPAPHFCTSPVCSKCRVTNKNGEPVDGAQTSKKKVVVNTLLHEDQTDELERNLGHQNSHTAVPSTVNLMVPGALAKSSEHIDQLESNLSSLKVLISDLVSTVKENLENHSQTESTTESEFSFKGGEHSEQSRNDQHAQLCQNDCDSFEDNLGGADFDSSDSEYRDLPRRQSIDNNKKSKEDTGPEPIFSDADDFSVNVLGEGDESVNSREIRLVNTLVTERVKEKGTGKERLTVSYGSSRMQPPPAKCILSAAQRMRIPDVFRNIPSEIMIPCNVSVLSDTSNQPVERRNEMAVEGLNSSQSPSLNQSYDVDTPSDLWLLDGSGSDSGSKSGVVEGKHMTPECRDEGQGRLAKVKRRLLMQTAEETQGRSPDTNGGGGDRVVRPRSSTPRGSAVSQSAGLWYNGHGSQKKQEQLKQVHAAQIRALQHEHRRQQQELRQALAARYHLLQSVSLPCSVSASRLGDTLTFSTLSQPSSSQSEHYRHLLSAAVKGYLTRRLLRTERVAQLVRTIRDTRQFLLAFQLQNPNRGELFSRQDLLLQERVTLQLRAALYGVYDIFFVLSAGERMQFISLDRDLTRERELRRQSEDTVQPRRMSFLSAATQKALERKRGVMTQKKGAERHRNVVKKTGHKTGISAEQPQKAKRGQFRANPLRVPKSALSARPR